MQTDFHLERINAAAAYARGATGAGEKILIVDTGVRPSHREFSGADKLTMEALFPSDPYIPDPNALTSSHGTAVASIAAGGRDFDSGLNMQGVAFNANIHFAYLELGTSDGIFRRFDIPTGSAGTTFAQRQANFYQSIISIAEARDVLAVNLSFSLAAVISDYPRAVVENAFGLTAAALAQNGTPDAEKKILIFAASNDGAERLPNGDPAPFDAPSVVSALGLYFPELRGHAITVVALDQEGRIADYSNRCGMAKVVCVAAPGSDILFASYEGDTVYRRGDGTSFAAPIVTGSLAVLKQYFRGQLGNTEVVDRLLATANRDGIYADSETYGHGLIDLDAATRPVAAVMTGLPGQQPSAITASRLRLPAVYGSAVASAFANIEVVGFDGLDHPFWYPAGSLVHTQPTQTIPLAQRMTDNLLAEQRAFMPTLPWHSTAAAGQSDALRFAAQGTTFGFSGSLHHGHGKHFFGSRLMRGLRAGFLVEKDGHQGVRPTGAFGSTVRSSMVFLGHEGEWRMPTARNWSLHSRVLLGIGEPEYTDSAMFQASDSLYSFAALQLRYTTGEQRTVFSIEQPLRVETGTGTLRYATGRTYDGTRLYDTTSFSLTPNARAVQLNLRHDHQLFSGKVALELMQTINANHVAGDREFRISLGYSVQW